MSVSPAPASHEEPHRKKRKVHVMVRVRPQLPSELAFPPCVSVQEDQVNLSDGTSSFSSSYQRVFSAQEGQADVYAKVHEAIQEAFTGYNTSIIAYGQTGTGKTYTMMGPPDVQASQHLGEISESHGIVPRAVQSIFAHSTAKGAVNIVVSYMEIYNDQIHDLLEPYKNHLRAGKEQKRLKQPRARLQIREDADGATHVQHLRAVRVTSVDQVLQIVQQGNENRSVRHTEMNQHSSRGHGILQFQVEQRVETKAHCVMRTKINFVDLAGSERSPDDAKKSARMTEMNAINVSLSALATVVASLTSRAQHVPYRDSRLTHLLKDSLGGNCNTFFIATISPLATAFPESVSTLKFADRASNIVNSVVRNERQDIKGLLEQKDAEINRLRELLREFQHASTMAQPSEANLEQTSGAHLSTASNSINEANDLQKQIDKLQDALNQERQRVSALEARMNGTILFDSPEALKSGTVASESQKRSARGTETPQAESPQATPPAPAHGKRRRPGKRRTQRSISGGSPAARIADHMYMFSLPQGSSNFALGLGGGSSPQTHGDIATGAAYERMRGHAHAYLDDAPSPGHDSAMRSKASARQELSTRDLGRQLIKDHAAARRAADRVTSVYAPAQTQPSGTNTPSRRRNKRQQDFEHLKQMYSKLVGDVAKLSVVDADEPRLRGKETQGRHAHVADTSYTPGAAPGRLKQGLSPLASSPKSEQRSKGTASSGFGLSSVAPTSGSSSPASLRRAGLSPASASPASKSSPTSGFGLTGVMQKSPQREKRSVQRHQPLGPPPDMGLRKGLDLFDEGSWMYIMGPSMSSTKARNIARRQRALIH